MGLDSTVAGDYCRSVRFRCPVGVDKVNRVRRPGEVRQPGKRGMETVKFANKRKKNRAARKRKGKLK